MILRKGCALRLPLLFESCSTSCSCSCSCSCSSNLVEPRTSTRPRTSNLELEPRTSNLEPRTSISISNSISILRPTPTTPTPLLLLNNSTRTRTRTRSPYFVRRTTIDPTPDNATHQRTVLLFLFLPPSLLPSPLQIPPMPVIPLSFRGRCANPLHVAGSISLAGCVNWRRVAAPEPRLRAPLAGSFRGHL